MSLLLCFSLAALLTSNTTAHQSPPTKSNPRPAVVIVDLLPPSAPNFGAVLAQFQRRMRAVLSSPVLATLALAEAEEDAAAARAAGEDAARRAADEAAAAAHPRRRGSGLFRCFSRPAVLEDGAASREPSARGGSARGGSPRGDCSAYSGRGDFSAYSGRGELSTRSGISLRGGSERSVRAGCPRDPSVRGYLRATSVEVRRGPPACLPACRRFLRSMGISGRPCGGHTVHFPASPQADLRLPAPAGAGGRRRRAVGALRLRPRAQPVLPVVQRRQRRLSH